MLGLGSGRNCSSLSEVERCPEKLVDGTCPEGSLDMPVDVPVRCRWRYRAGS